MVCLNWLIPVAHASGINITDDDYVSLETASVIEALYEERGRLAVDFEENEAQIDAIDAQLERLGVETVSAEYVQQQKADAEICDSSQVAMPMYDVPEDGDGLAWTSYRTQYNCRGTMYEVQVVTCVPTSANSDLVVTAVFTESDTDQQIRDARKSQFNAVASAVTGLSPIGQYCSIVETMYEIAAAELAISETTEVYGAQQSMMVNGDVTLTYIFCKTPGAVDAGNQAICYMGSVLHYVAAINYACGYIDAQGRYTTDVVTTKYEETVKSPYYDTRFNTACENFYYYKNYGQDYEHFYYLDYVTVGVTMTNASGNVTQSCSYRLRIPYF